MYNILVTGCAGFIGFYTSKRLLASGAHVIGTDNMNNYYDVSLKKDRLKLLEKFDNFTFIKHDLIDKSIFDQIFFDHKPDYVIHLAAQAGVRYSIENPNAYIDSNIIGFFNVLEVCRKYPVKHLLYASSSSVYGGNKIVPFSVKQNVDHPVSLYAATKKSNELMAHTYSHLYGIPTTGMRFFTVYGPWGRPDMAYFSFTKDIVSGEPIKVFNYGKMERDFTYIEDVVDGIYGLIERPPVYNEHWDERNDDISTSFAPYKIYNIGNNHPVTLMSFINTLESLLNKKAEIIYTEMQPGDVLRTYADITEIERDINFKPNTSLEEGLSVFVKWFKEYYEII